MKHSIVELSIMKGSCLNSSLQTWEFKETMIDSLMCSVHKKK